MSKLPKTKVNSSIIKKSVPKTKTQINKAVFSFQQFRCQSIKCKEFNNMFKNLWEYGAWSLVLLDRLSNYSTMEIAELKGGGDGTRCHPVHDEALERLVTVLKTMGIVCDEQFNEDGLWELSLGAASGRVFGYFVDNIFYTLLFDPHHLIYPNTRYESQHDLLYRNYDPWSEIAN
ncbi:hypothetical protein [Clostridium lacusfryxellense]|uniref:hypothetical protein n=1 Tax=Clostridium lacusfryxellense TaxID=205328 RepID=UPI001C0B76D4|nr:hypothetical protein [Clostridium lacusfryxellense]MBU3114630.1 hypothetical protein [Clostridium lacusfryxellense]